MGRREMLVTMARQSPHVSSLDMKRLCHPPRWHPSTSSSPCPGHLRRINTPSCPSTAPARDVRGVRLFEIGDFISLRVEGAKRSEAALKHQPQRPNDYPVQAAERNTEMDTSSRVPPPPLFHLNWLWTAVGMWLWLMHHPAGWEWPTSDREATWRGVRRGKVRHLDQRRAETQSNKTKTPPINVVMRQRKCPIIVLFQVRWSSWDNPNIFKRLVLFDLHAKKKKKKNQDVPSVIIKIRGSSSI